MSGIRTVCVGLGFIGIEIARAALHHPDLELVAAVDTAPGLAGTPLAQLLANGTPTSLAVAADLARTLAETDPDVVLVSTSSRAEAVAPQVMAALESSAAVISTCEELVCPWGRPEADAIAKSASDSGKAVLATGVNPGFVMDLVPALLSLPCRHIDAILVERTVDLSRRRDALRKKAGVGISTEEFARRADVDGIGHIGLDASARLLAFVLGADDGSLPKVSIAPLVDATGTVYGFRQRTGYPPRDEIPAIELHLEMSMQPESEGDRIEITGEPSVTAEIEGGLFGDSATAALVVNAVPLVLAAPAGLHTVLDIPALRGWKAPTC